MGLFFYFFCIILVRGIDFLYGDVGYSRYAKAYLACPIMPKQADSFFYCNYALNTYLLGQKTTNATHNVQISKIKAPSMTGLVFETHYNAKVGIGCDEKAGQMLFNTEYACFRHKKKNQTLMIDGHVEPLAFEYVSYRYPTEVPINQQNLHPQKAGYKYPESALPFKCVNKL